MNLDFTNVDEPIFSFDWRNRFENNIDCLLTTIDNVPVTPVQAKQYWGGKTLKVRWQLFFYYDDYATISDNSCNNYKACYYCSGSTVPSNSCNEAGWQDNNNYVWNQCPYCKSQCKIQATGQDCNVSLYWRVCICIFL